MLKEKAVIFPVKDAKMFIQTGGKYGQGSNFYAAKNPAYGATFTYYLQDVPKTLKAERQENEKKLFKEKKPIPQPTVEQLKAEESELAPYLVFSIRDAQGKEIRKLTSKANKEMKRITWDLRYQSNRPVSSRTEKFTPVAAPSGGGRRFGGGGGMPVMPGDYSISLSMVSRDGVTQLTSEVPFKAAALNLATLPAEDREAVASFNAKASELAGTMYTAQNFTADLQKKVVLIKQTIHNTSGTSQELMDKASEVEQALDNVAFLFEGTPAKASWEEVPPAQMPLNRRMSAMVYATISSTSGTTQTQIDSYEILKEELAPVLEELKTLNGKLKELNNELDAIGAPWTPGRLPGWQ
jgi:hypothetical protein